MGPYNENINVDGQNCLGPNWVAHAGPKRQPIKNPHGAHMEMLAGLQRCGNVILWLQKNNLKRTFP